MSVVTISAIKADVGGYVGHSAVHPRMLEEATRRVHEAIASGLLVDGAANACGDDVKLVMTHHHGVDAEPVHRFAWETFEALTEIAHRLHLYGAGQDLLAEAFSGNVRGAGPGMAEMEIVERPSEPFIVFAADKCAPRLELAGVRDVLRPVQHGRPGDRREHASRLCRRGARPHRA